MNKETLFTIDLKNLDSPFEREKLESLPKEILVELLIQHIKRTFNALDYMKHYIEVEEYSEPVKIEFEVVIKLLKGTKKYE